MHVRIVSRKAPEPSQPAFEPKMEERVLGRKQRKTLAVERARFRPGRPAGQCSRREQRTKQSTRRPDMSSTTASQEELKAHRVPLAWRDQCSAYVITVYSYAVSPDPLLAGHEHIYPTSCLLNRPDRPPAPMDPSGYYARSLLLPLNVCRKDKYYLPWECENERHAYEKCVLSSWFFFFWFIPS